MRSLSAAKDCLQVEKHRHFVAFFKDVRCLEKLNPSLFEVYAFSLLKRASDLTGDEKKMKSTRVLGPRSVLPLFSTCRLLHAYQNWTHYIPNVV